MQTLKISLIVYFQIWKFSACQCQMRTGQREQKNSNWIDRAVTTQCQPECERLSVCWDPVILAVFSYLSRHKKLAPMPLTSSCTPSTPFIPCNLSCMRDKNGYFKIPAFPANHSHKAPLSMSAHCCGRLVTQYSIDYCNDLK